MSVESPFRQHTQFDLEQDHKMNDHIPGHEDSYFALKRASPADHPRELIDRISMSAPSSTQPEKLK